MKVIAVSGFARCGKDTFVSIATNILEKNGYKTIKLAFADALKNDIDDWLKEKYGISAWTNNNKEKELIRPFFVAHGCGKRIQTDGKYWIDIIDGYLSSIIPNENTIVFISDTRFQNEAKWIHDKWNGTVIHIRKYTIAGLHSTDVLSSIGDKVYDRAPNAEEAKQDPLVEEISDIHMEWEDISGASIINNEYLSEKVLISLNSEKLFNGKLHL